MILLPNVEATVLRPTVVTDMGSQFTDWENPQRVPFPEPCHVQDGATREAYDRADAVETDYTLWAPLSPRIHPGDHLEFTYTAEKLAGTTVTDLQVHGRPRIMIDPLDPAESFQRVELKRIEG